MITSRKCIFETNSSSNHSYTINIGNYTSIECWDEYEHEDIYLDEWELCEILDHIPISKLEEALKRRENNEEN